jgi:S-DNA-T family DNA segregation ATPase FtsK/SpoIIIE
VQGCFVDDEETDRVVEFWQEQYPEHDDTPPWQSFLARIKVIDDTDDEIEQAIALCQKYDTISTSLLQRRLRVGFPRAARIMEQLYEMGVVEDPKTGGKTRKTYVSDDDDDPLGDIIANREN